MPTARSSRISKTERRAREFRRRERSRRPRAARIPASRTSIGNALRELNLEDVEPAAAPRAEQPTIVEYRTFDGLVVRVTGIERNDESWITLEASVDSRKRPPAAPPAAAPAEGARTAPPTPAADPSAEAARINAKAGGWRYKIAGFQYDQMTRRMADLLKPAAGGPGERRRARDSVLNGTGPPGTLRAVCRPKRHEHAAEVVSHRRELRAADRARARLRRRDRVAARPCAAPVGAARPRRAA